VGQCGVVSAVNLEPPDEEMGKAVVKMKVKVGVLLLIVPSAL
jgi:hypothetical protein